MMRFALFFASGEAFFAGSALLVFSLLLSVKRKQTWAVRASALAGMGMIGLSAMPISYWLYGLLLACTIAWLLASCTPRVGSRWRAVMAFTAAVACAAAALVELAHLPLPRVGGLAGSRLVVIGDSLSAGMRKGEKTWPTILREEHSWEVLDLSQAGATVHSALNQAAQIPPGPSAVLLEIGGNDLLGRASTESFEADLNQLLARVRSPDRKLLMCELPLPPLRGEYGRIQRKLAARHGVELIPRRVLSSVIGAPGATLDGLHLSEAGHRLLARTVLEMDSISVDRSKRMKQHIRGE